MERKEIATLIAMNKSNYPNAYKDIAEAQTKVLLDSWHNAFTALPADLVMAAYHAALRYCKFPVTIADIFEQLRDMQDALQAPPEELWQQFLRAANKCRELSHGYHYSAESFRYPGITQGQEYRRNAQAIFRALPDEVQAYIGSLNRLEDFGGMDEAHLEQVIFPAFRRFVIAERKRNMTRQSLSPAALDALGGGRQMALAERGVERTADTWLDYHETGGTA